VRGDGLAQLGDTRPRRVLVTPAGQHSVGRQPGQFGRTVGVRETLAQVDGAGGGGQRRHLGEDRGAHAVQAPVQQRSAHRRPLYTQRAHARA